MIAEFVHHYPSYRAEHVRRMPLHLFLTMRAVYLGGPNQRTAPQSEVEEMEQRIIDAEAWRERHGVTRLPRPWEDGEED